MRHRLASMLRTVGMLVIAALLSGCPVGPSYERPDLDPGQQYGNQPSASFRADPVLLNWWKQFRDPTLIRLIELAVKNNYDLQAAEANLREARALFIDAGLNLLPHITSRGSYNQLQRSLAALNNRSFVPRNLNLYSVGFDTFWEVDIWGRVRRDIQSKEAEVQSAEAERRMVTLSVISELARNYMELRGHQNQMAVDVRNAKNQKETWEWTQARQEVGIGTEFDSSRAAAQYETTLALIPPQESQIRMDIHRISVLTGQIPSALLGELTTAASIPTEPPIVRIGDPASLLRRRPDIQMVERQLASATARIGVATGDLFPRVTFIGSVNLESASLTGLGAPGAGAYSFGPRITWPALESFQLYARLKGVEAHADANLATYKQTVLNALEETENALVVYSRLMQRRALLKTASDASYHAYEIGKARFDEGVDEFINLLDTERRLLLDQREYAASQTETAAALIAVYKALGGGWEVFQTPEDAQRPIETLFTP